MSESDGIGALERILNPDKGECPVCGGLKLYGEYCLDCTKHKRNMEELRRARARRRAFGSIW